MFYLIRITRAHTLSCPFRCPFSHIVCLAVLVCATLSDTLALAFLIKAEFTYTHKKTTCVALCWPAHCDGGVVANRACVNFVRTRTPATSAQQTHGNAPMTRNKVSEHSMHIHNIDFIVGYDSTRCGISQSFRYRESLRT